MYELIKAIFTMEEEKEEKNLGERKRKKPVVCRGHFHEARIKSYIVIWQGKL